MARSRSTSSGVDCGPVKPSGNTSHHHALPHCPWQQAPLIPSMLPLPAHPPSTPPPPPPPSLLLLIYTPQSSSGWHHRQCVANTLCWVAVGYNHALSGCSSHLLPVPVLDNPNVYNPRASAQTIYKLSGTSVGYSHPLYIYLPLPRPPVNCLMPVSDYSMCHSVV